MLATLTIALGADSRSGLGTDTLSYEDRGVGVSVNLGTATATDVTTLGAIENLRGSAFIDSLTGDSGPNVIVGLGGADSIDGEGGSDTASFGDRSTPVTIDFGLTTSPGDDQHTDGDTFADVEIFEGGSAGDVFRGNDGLAETFLGGAGDDDFRGGIGADGFTGGPGPDTVRYDEPTRTAAVSVSLTAGATTGGDGDVLIDAIENAVGGPASDELTANAIPNVLTAGDGNDSVTGGSGEDFLQLGRGDDTFDSADSERDVVDCAGGNDSGAADALDALADCEPPPSVSPLARIAAGVKSRFDARARYTKVVKLTVTNMPAGGAIELTCARKRRGQKKRSSCPFKKYATDADASLPQVKLAGRFKGHKLKPGTVVGLTLTAPGLIGERVEYTMRRDKRPRTVQTCVPPDGAPADC